MPTVLLTNLQTDRHIPKERGYLANKEYNFYIIYQKIIITSKQSPYYFRGVGARVYLREGLTSEVLTTNEVNKRN